MGIVFSSYFEEKDEDPTWANDVQVSESDENTHTSSNQNQDLVSAKLESGTNASKEISEEHKQKLNEFKLELDRKHEKRRTVIAEKRKEMEALRQELELMKQENAELKSRSSENCDEENQDKIKQLRKENEDLRTLLNEKSSIIEESEIVVRKNHELRINIAEMQRNLQRLNTEVLNFENEREDYRKHVVALKDVITVSKSMLQIRESQLKELKEKVECIEKSLADREVTVMSEDLRQEYERQIANMKNLRVLYEERQSAERRAKEEMAAKLADAKKELEQQEIKNSELQERISELELDNSNKYDEIKSLESNLGLSKAENRQYQEELAVINQLFTETLLRYNTSQELDLDKLQKQLEDHHGLLKDIVDNEGSSEVSYALPKVLLELINQLYASEKVTKDESFDQIISTEDSQECVISNSRPQMSSPEEIVENLPKVWRVLIELLSHRMVPNNVLTDDEKNNENNPCYKKVETAKGPSLVLSVSQTFIRLKNLILEKKSLEKETAHLKHLNGHLENRLQDQEKRLGLVQNELSKTWLMVGKLQKQHQLLHTQEQILRYELAQKRKLLNDLKEELEDSREKWTQAREKNANTEEQWKQLRTEFANRRNLTTLDDLNNSGESGYSDDRECSSDEEPGYETDVSECDKKNSEKEVEKDLEVDNSSIELLNNQTCILTTKDTSSEDTISTNQDTEVSSSSSNVSGTTSNPTENCITSSETIREPINEYNVPKILPNIYESSEQEHIAIPQPSNSCQNNNTCEKSKEITSNTDTNNKDCFFVPEFKPISIPESSQIINRISNEASTSETPLSKPNFEEILADNEEHIRELEGEASILDNRATITNIKTNNSNKLVTHEIYKENDIKESIYSSNVSETELNITENHFSSTESLKETKNDNFVEMVPNVNEIPKQEIVSVAQDSEKELIQKHLQERPLVMSEGSDDIENRLLMSKATQEPSRLEEPDIHKPSTSSEAPDTKPTFEEILARREERLKRLEGQASSLVNKAANTAIRSINISNKLDNLHELYGESTDNGNNEILEHTEGDTTNVEH